MQADTHQEVRHHGSSKPPAANDQNSNQSLDVAEAIALMADLGDDTAEDEDGAARGGRPSGGNLGPHCGRPPVVAWTRLLHSIK